MTTDEQSRVDELLGLDDGLSDREIQFLEDIDERMSSKELSPAQSDWLKRISERF